MSIQFMIDGRCLLLSCLSTSSKTNMFQVYFYFFNSYDFYLLFQWQNLRKPNFIFFLKIKFQVDTLVEQSEASHWMNQPGDFL